MDITTEQEKLLLEKGFTGDDVAALRKLDPKEQSDPVALGFADTEKRLMESQLQIEDAHPGLRTFSDRGLPIFTASATTEVLVGAMLDPRVTSVAHALGKRGTPKTV